MMQKKTEKSNCVDEKTVTDKLREGSVCIAIQMVMDAFGTSNEFNAETLGKKIMCLALSQSEVTMQQLKFTAINALKNKKVNLVYVVKVLIELQKCGQLLEKHIKHMFREPTLISNLVAPDGIVPDVQAQIMETESLLEENPEFATMVKKHLPQQLTDLLNDGAMMTAPYQRIG